MCRTGTQGSKSQPLPDRWLSCCSAGMTMHPSCDRHSTPPLSRWRFPVSPQRRRDDRGVSMSVLVTVLLPILLISAGVAVDGAERSRAVRVAHTVAAEAARAGCEEGSAAQLVGQDGSSAARVAAEASARKAKADGLSQLVINVNGDAVSVATEITRPTRLLALIGLTEVHGRASEMCTLLAR